MITYKVKYKKYIVNLYVPEQKSGKVVLLLPGLPMSTNINNILRPFFDAGAIVFYPYFSGSYDSGGMFSASRSIKDASALYPLTQMPKVTELYFAKQIELGVPKETILAGMSYGACIALLGHNNLYQKIILLSPALLFNPDDIGGPAGKAFQDQMRSLLHLLKNAHPFTYRIRFSRNLKKFLLGESTAVRKRSISNALDKVGCPTLILHGENDTSVPVGITRSLEKEVTSQAISWVYIDAAHSTSSYGEDGLTRLQKFVEE